MGDQILWYYPQSIDDAVEIHSTKKSIYHAGGTFILMGKKFPEIEAIVDLWHLPLDYFDTVDDSFEIGAMNTYAAAVEKISAVNPEHILVKSLSAAASTPLRNRITLGGSFRAFPAWTDLLGPLIALDATVKLASPEGKTQVPATQYIENIASFRDHLVVGFSFPAGGWNSAYVRRTRTRVDFAAFNITVLVRKSADGTVDDIRIVVVGNSTKFARLTQLEDKIRGTKISEVNLPQEIKSLDIKFGNKSLGSGEYIRDLFNVELERILLTL